MVHYHSGTKPEPEKQIYRFPRHMIVISISEDSHVMLCAFIQNKVCEIIRTARKCLVVKLGAHINVVAEIISPFRVSVVFVGY